MEVHRVGTAQPLWDPKGQPWTESTLSLWEIRKEERGNRTTCFTVSQDYWSCSSCLNCFHLSIDVTWSLYSHVGFSDTWRNWWCWFESVKGTFFLYFPLPKIEKEMKIPFFQETCRSCDPDTRPLCKLFCWSIVHPIPTPKIAASSWNSFLLPHLKAGSQSSSADTYHHFLERVNTQAHQENGRSVKRRLPGQ